MSKYKQYENGYYKYSVTFTFRDDTEFCRLNPIRAQKLFKDKITKYMDKRHILYELHPEISKSGRFHYHGIIIMKCNSTDFTEHERVIRLFKNFCNRSFGMNFWQQIQSFESEYTVEDIRFRITGKKLVTTFQHLYDYITKDATLFPYLIVICNL